MLPVMELKHRYKVLKAKGVALDITDMGVPVPISTGSPFLDSMLNERVKQTPSMNSEEHLMRSWHLIRNAGNVEIEAALANLDGCLTDHKMLLALRLFAESHDDFPKVLDSMPLKWRIMFPTAVIKPASVFLEGWKRDIPFRLVKDIDYPKLRAAYHEVLSYLPEAQILKFRMRLKEALALVHWKPEGTREEQIRNWCFEGRGTFSELDLLRLYCDMRSAIKDERYYDFINMQETAPQPIPLTSYMGLLSTRKINLVSDKYTRFRPGAVRCATAVEALLRCNEWGYWLSDNDVKEIGKKIDERMKVTIPFAKIVGAYIHAPWSLKDVFFDHVYLPMMKRFSASMAQYIPKGTEVVLMQPQNFVNAMSILFLTTISYDRSTRVLLVGETLESIDNKTVLNYDTLRPVLNAGRSELEAKILELFGGQALKGHNIFNEKVFENAFEHVDPDDTLILDLPFVFSVRVLERMLHQNKVLNLSNYYGSPAEIPISIKYEPRFNIIASNFGYYSYRRKSDTAVQGLAEFIERLGWFGSCAEVVV